MNNQVEEKRSLAYIHSHIYLLDTEYESMDRETVEELLHARSENAMMSIMDKAEEPNSFMPEIYSWADDDEGRWTPEKPREAGWYRAITKLKGYDDIEAEVVWLTDIGEQETILVCGDILENNTEVLFWDHRRIDFLPVPEGEG